ncbi:MAG: hypothetical protein WDN28_32145 [Chthoniobacter sp.]
MASRPKAAIAFGCARKKAGFFPDEGEQFIEIVGRGRAGPRGDALFRRHFPEEPEFRMIDELPFLALAHGFHGEAHLLAELVDAVAVEVGDAGVRVQHGLDRAEVILARILFVIDEGGGQLRLATIHGDDLGLGLDVRLLILDDAVDAIDAAVHIDPRQELVQPARGDLPHLQNGDGGGGQVARGGGAEAGAGLIVVGHDRFFLGGEGGEVKRRSGEGLGKSRAGFEPSCDTLCGRANCRGVVLVTHAK